VYIRPRRSHSNSFGNDAEKDTAGCRAFFRKYIVIGTENYLYKQGALQNEPFALMAPKALSSHTEGKIAYHE